MAGACRAEKVMRGLSNLIRNVPIVTSIEVSPSVVFRRSRQAAPRGGGKVGNLLLVFHFSTAHKLNDVLLPNNGDRPVVGAVGMWESRGVCEISKGLWERVESPPLAFHRFHSPVISTAPVYLFANKNCALLVVVNTRICLQGCSVPGLWAAALGGWSS